MPFCFYPVLEAYTARLS